MSLNVFTSVLQKFAAPCRSYIDSNFDDNPIILEVIPGEGWYESIRTIEGVEIRFHQASLTSQIRISQALAQRVPVLPVIVKALPFDNTAIRQNNVESPNYLQVVTPHHYHSLSLMLKVLVPHLKRGAEVGVFEGECGSYLLKAFPDLYLYGIDPWTSYPGYQGDNMNNADTRTWEDRYYLSMHLYDTTGRGRNSVMRCQSTEAEIENLDFAFIDANHDFEFVLKDLHYWYPRVREGGLICGHDYCWPQPESPVSVKKAVLRFMVEANLMRTIFITEHFVWGFIK